MKSNFPAAFGIGLVVIAVAVGGVLYMQRGSKVDLPGKILKVRTAPLDENSSVVVIDFRTANPSDYVLQARGVTVELEDPAGRSYLGSSIGEVDAQRLFEGVPVLGTKFNPTLLLRDRIAAHSSVDRMIAARFQAPVSLLDGRKRFIVRVEEIDGKTFEYSER